MALLDCFTELIAYTAYVADTGEAASIEYDAVSKTVHELVARSEACRDARGIDPEDWRKAFFPVSAWVDERLLCSAWPGKGAWEGAQLQREHFNTTAAGEEFYTRLNALDSKERDVREVYAFCLALGFRGQYFEASHDGKMEDIRYTNLKRVTDNTDLAFPSALFPEGYEPDTGKRKTGKRRAWRGFTPFSFGIALLPVLVFAGLYVLFERMLQAEVTRFFGTGF